LLSWGWVGCVVGFLFLAVFVGVGLLSVLIWFVMVRLAGVRLIVMGLFVLISTTWSVVLVVVATVVFDRPFQERCGDRLRIDRPQES
jgi:hypothetical protein